MNYSANKFQKGKIDLKVEATAAEFEAAYNLVVEKLGRGAKIAGFRPGKIPVDVLEQNLGLTRILNETASYLVSRYLSEILQKEEITPITSPQISVDSLVKGQVFSFTASVISKPKIKVLGWKKIRVKKVPAKEVTEKDVDESIANIYEAWKKSPAAGKQAENVEDSDEDSDKKFIYDAQGNKIFLNDDTKDKKVEGKGTVDDEFAKKIGANDLAHLKELVRGDLEALVADHVESKFEQEVFEKLAESVEVEVPDILVDDELNRILIRLNSQLEGQSKTLDDYLKENNTTIDGLKAKWREQATTNVKTSLILDAIGKEEKVQVTKEEVEKATAGVNQANMSNEQKQDLERYLVFSIFQAKTLDLVKKSASEVGASKAA